MGLRVSPIAIPQHGTHGCETLRIPVRLKVALRRDGSSRLEILSKSSNFIKFDRRVFPNSARTVRIRMCCVQVCASFGLNLKPKPWRQSPFVPREPTCVSTRRLPHRIYWHRPRNSLRPGAAKPAPRRRLQHRVLKWCAAQQEAHCPSTKRAEEEPSPVQKKPRHRRRRTVRRSAISSPV